MFWEQEACNYTSISATYNSNFVSGQYTPSTLPLSVLKVFTKCLAAVASFPRKLNMSLPWLESELSDQQVVDNIHFILCLFGNLGHMETRGKNLYRFSHNK